MSMFQKSWVPLRIDDDGRVYGADGTLIASRKMTNALRELFAEEARGRILDLFEEDSVFVNGTPIPDPDPTGEYPDGWHPAGCDDCEEGETELPGPLVMAVGDLGHDQIGKTIRVKINEYMTMEAVLYQVMHHDNNLNVPVTTLWFEHEDNKSYQVRDIGGLVEVFYGQ